MRWGEGGVGKKGPFKGWEQNKSPELLLWGFQGWTDAEMSSHSSGVSAQELVCDFLAGNELSPLCCNNYFKGPPTVQGGVFLRPTVSQPAIMSAVPSGSTDPLLVFKKSDFSWLSLALSTAIVLLPGVSALWFSRGAIHTHTRVRAQESGELWK